MQYSATFMLKLISIAKGHFIDWLLQHQDPHCNESHLVEMIIFGYGTCICGCIGNIYSYSNVAIPDIPIMAQSVIGLLWLMLHKHVLLSDLVRCDDRQISKLDDLHSFISILPVEYTDDITNYIFIVYQYSLHHH